jgi:hypothetical protein
VRSIRRALVPLAVAVAALVFAGGAGATTNALQHYGPKTCNGSILRSGSYASLHVTGPCKLSDHAYVVVRGNVVVGHHGLFDAITMGHIGVWGSMYVRSGGGVGLGCSPAAGCSVTTHDHIQGDVIANGALAMIFHSNRIDGRIYQSGGGGGVNCNNVLMGGPAFTTYEDNKVGGDVTVRWMRSCWFGFFRNHVAGTVRINHNTFADPDADEVQTNVIAGDLICRANSPAPQTGDSGGSVNIVAGSKIGQCSKV